MFCKGLFWRQIVTFENLRDFFFFFYWVYVTLRFIYREKCIFSVRVKNWQPHLARDAQCEYIRCFISLFSPFRYQLKTWTFRERSVYLLHPSGFFFFFCQSEPRYKWMSAGEVPAHSCFGIICKSSCTYGYTLYWSMREIIIATRGTMLLWFDKEIH